MENRQEGRPPSEQTVALDTQHLVMNGIKSGFNVKDLIDLQDSKDKVLSAATTATVMPCHTEAAEHQIVVEYHPGTVLMEHMDIAQQAAAAAAMTPDTNDGSDHLATVCVHDPGEAAMTMGGDVIVNGMLPFDQDNLYTRWLQSNNVTQYTSKYRVVHVLNVQSCTCVERTA